MFDVNFPINRNSNANVRQSKAAHRGVLPWSGRLTATPRRLPQPDRPADQRDVTHFVVVVVRRQQRRPQQQQQQHKKVDANKFLSWCFDLSTK